MSQPTNTVVNCACLIHGDGYSWTYVDKLYNMLCRNLSYPVRLHVYTEAHRPVPEHMIKHTLIDWGISGPRRSWWYKMQLFDSSHYAGPMLYLDLDTVIVNNIDWILDLPLNSFWTIQDFKHLWRYSHQGINSSLMWWDTQKFDYVWQKFQQQNLMTTIKKHAGDQDFITQVISGRDRQFVNSNQVKSWRWQCFDGGYDFKHRMYKNPGTGTHIPHGTSILIFHGQPKPHQITEPAVVCHWQ